MVFEGTKLGASNHGALGADYLKKKGFDNDITDYVRAHVLAKRYLCWKDPKYYESRYIFSQSESLSENICRFRTLLVQ